MMDSCLDRRLLWRNPLNPRPTVARLAVWMALGLACACAAALGAQNHAPWTVESVLRQMDKQAGSSHSPWADFEGAKVPVVGNDHSTDISTILLHGDKMLLQIKPPDARTVL